MDVLTIPQLAVPTANDAIEIVNRWLHREVGMAVHAVTATFDPTTFYWHLPVELAWKLAGREALIIETPPAQPQP